ncbi:MAG: phosphoribosylamine--glycine ligase [Elusimicrobia bacterium]|jgi:phosphoribosylamine--glycine ligase|nr:phosphoribosylamine--glycine ligase [Elusimicrobiota bacterium]
MEKDKPLSGNGPRRILCISRVGCIGDLCRQLKAEGNLVKYFIESKHDKDVSDGFVEKVDDWKTAKEWADLLIFDDSDYGKEVEALRKEGKAVVGGTLYTDRLEDDRDFGQQEMKAAGMTILPHWTFSSFEEAILFVKTHPARYVVKPSGSAQNDKVLSYVGQEEDGHDVLAMLERYKKSWARQIKSFQIQKYATGVEVAIGGFFNGKEFILPVCINFEHKKMFNDDIGPSTGEMGTSMFYDGDSILYRETIAKMTSRLAAVGFVGYFDINCIATSRAIYPLECTPRFGYPTLSIQMEGSLSRWGDFFQGIAQGQTPTLRTKKGFQVGVVIAVPPFPFEDTTAFERYSAGAVVFFKKPVTEGFYPGDIKVVDGEWVLAGQTGYALVCTGSGPTMEDASREAYNRVKNIIIPNMFYRTDIGDRWRRDGDLLRTWGYL